MTLLLFDIFSLHQITTQHQFVLKTPQNKFQNSISMYIFFSLSLLFFFPNLFMSTFTNWNSLLRVKNLEAVVIRCSISKMIWKTSHNLKENTLGGVLGRRQHAHKNRHYRTCFSCNFVKNFNAPEGMSSKARFEY